MRPALTTVRILASRLGPYVFITGKLAHHNAATTTPLDDVVVHLARTSSNAVNEVIM